MTSHQLLMQAVERFWSDLAFVNHCPEIEDDYQCVMVQPNRETVIRSVEWTPDTLLPYRQYRRDPAMIEIGDCLFPRIVIERYLRSKGVLTHEGNTFTVFFPGDDKLEVFAARTGSETCGLTRNIAWWAVKHGIEDSRICNVRMEGSQCVMDVAVK